MARKRPAPFSLRLTFEQRAKLEAAAGDRSLAAYIHERLFESEDPTPRRRTRHPVKDQQALSQVLGKLGETRLSSNLNQLARAVNTGSLAVTPDTEAALLNAATEIGEIRSLLIDALNLREGP